MEKPHGGLVTGLWKNPFVGRKGSRSNVVRFTQELRSEWDIETLQLSNRCSLIGLSRNLLWGVVKMHKLISTAFVAAAMMLNASSLGLAQEFSITSDQVIQNVKDFSPFVDQHFPNKVLWGDTHLHTSNSPDAGMVGNSLSPDAAYRFAKGEEVTSSGGLRTKLVRPLDFLVVSDHSEYMGLAPMLQSGDQALLDDPYGKQLYEKFNAGGDQAYAAFREIVQSVTEG
ncbi:MAG: DUF3604 domain-containing protein, partial [Hyphomicrobiales bacterium]